MVLARGVVDVVAVLPAVINHCRYYLDWVLGASVGLAPLCAGWRCGACSRALPSGGVLRPKAAQSSSSCLCCRRRVRLFVVFGLARARAGGGDPNVPKWTQARQAPSP